MSILRASYKLSVDMASPATKFRTRGSAYKLLRLLIILVCAALFSHLTLARPDALPSKPDPTGKIAAVHGMDRLP
jgi:hypothetical protein